MENELEKISESKHSYTEGDEYRRKLHESITDY